MLTVTMMVVMVLSHSRRLVVGWRCVDGWACPKSGHVTVMLNDLSQEPTNCNQRPQLTQKLISDPQRADKLLSTPPANTHEFG